MEGGKRKLKALSDIASVDITLEFNDILLKILKITCEAMDAHSSTLMLIDAGTEELRMVASYGLGQDYPERVHETARKAGVPLTYSPSGTVLRTGKYYIVPNVFDEPKGKPWLGLTKELGFSSIIFTPMKKGSETIGLLNIYMAEPHKFTDEEIDFITIAASQAASVVQNARMCSRLEENIQELQGFRENLEEKIEEAHKKLYESEAKYRDLFENADDPMYTIDTRGYFNTINNAGQRILGGGWDEIIGSHISRWLTPESYKASQEILEKQIMGIQLEQPVLIEVVCKSGEHKFGETRTRIIRDGDRITGIHGIARDVTEKMRLEQQLKEYHEELRRSYEELIEADRLRTEFISNITHELLTPLTSIRGFTELLYDETTGKVSSEQKKSLEIILRNSDRLIRLIKDLVDVSRLEKHRFGLQFGLVSVKDVLLKSAQDVQPQAKYKEITIIQDIEPLPRIWGDEGRLTQVITNLLSNAIKFTQEKGVITIAARESKSEIKISVTDTGIGIPADKLSRIFDRFYQIDGSSSRKYGGMGIGLSICKSIVESHYGTIWAESDGRGSTFHMILPKLENSEKHRS